MAKDKYQISLKVILTNQKGETLLFKCVENGSFAGFYELPGGRIDVDEFAAPLIDIVERELHEEVGEVQFDLHQQPVALGRHQIQPEFTEDKKATRVLYVFFEAELLSGEVVISDEHIGFEWVKLSGIELEKYFKSGILEGIKMYLGKSI